MTTINIKPRVWTNQLKIFSEEYGNLTDSIPVTADDGGGMPHHEANLRHWVDVLLGKAEPDFLPIQGVNMIKILEAMYKSAETGAEVRL